MLPRVIIHNAVSLDGHTTGFGVNLGLFYRLAGSWHEELTLAGSETILAARNSASEETGPANSEASGDTEARPGRLAIVDSRGRVTDWGFLKTAGFWGNFVALCATTTPDDHKALLRSQGVDVVVAGEGRVDLKLALEQLVERYGCTVVRVESGGVLNTVLLRGGLVSEISLLVHPVIVGGPGRTWVTEAGPKDLELASSQRLDGQYVWLRYRVRE